MDILAACCAGSPGENLTCFEAGDGEGGLSEKVLVVEHVDLVHDETQEGERGVIHSEAERLSGPRGVQTVIRCTKREMGTC